MCISFVVVVKCNYGASVKVLRSFKFIGRLVALFVPKLNNEPVFSFKPFEGETETC